MNAYHEDLLLDCEKEPLAYSGQVQSHGALLFMSRDTGKFMFGSTNLEDFVGESCQDLLGQNGREWLEEMLPDLIDLPTSAGDRRYLPQALDLGEGVMNVLVSPTATGWLIEIEKAEEGEGEHQEDSSLPELTTLDEMQPIQQAVVDRIAAITGYDRVMLYQFLPDWSGEVLAEAVQRSKGTYLSLRFPASDIPAIARGLYAQAPYRYIPLATNETVQVLGVADSGAQLDLTWSDLRSVSPVHIQYLTNMQVFASFSVSIMVEGKLWGLIASHNDAPGPISLAKRLACTRLIENFVSRIDEQRVIQQSLVAQVMNNQISASLAADKSSEQLAATVASAIAQVRDLIDFNRCVVDVGGHAVCSPSGLTPEATRALLSVVEGAVFENVDTWEVLPEDCPDRDRLWSEGVFGLSCFRVRASALNDALVTVLLLRPEESGEIAWAGNPEKPVEVSQSGGVKLSPRESFEKWVQVRKGMARVWNEDDLATLALLRRQLDHVLS